MINNLLDLINSETIYLAANWGVIPFWLLLIFIPNHGLTNFCTINYRSNNSGSGLCLFIL